MQGNRSKTPYRLQKTVSKSPIRPSNDRSKTVKKSYAEKRKKINIRDEQSILNLLDATLIIEGISLRNQF